MNLRWILPFCLRPVRKAGAGSNEAEFWRGAAVNVFRITPTIFQGPFPDDAAVGYLRACGVTAILNVSGGTADIAAGFACLSVPFPDGQPIPDGAIEKSVRFLEQCSHQGKPVFVHCAAGQNRSPTVIWLYLIASGMEPEQAITVFDGKTLDGVPGHPKLVGESQIAFARSLRSTSRTA